MHAISPRPIPNIHAPPGSLLGDASRMEFIQTMLSIARDVPMFWLPKSTETTTSTGVDKNAKTITYDATVAARWNALGSGLELDFNGTDSEADTPDTADLSFGNGSVDSPMSIVFLGDTDTIAAGTRDILTKLDLTTGTTLREWTLFNSTATLAFRLWDESAVAYIGKSVASYFAADTRVFGAVTYDGSGAESGIRVYKDAASSTLTADSSGTYVAMENTASLVRLSMEKGAAAQANFWNGKLSLVLLANVQLSQEDLWAMKAAVNSFYGLSL